jgi:aerobic carbon-monoxide dehydrogenase large subunit
VLRLEDDRLLRGLGCFLDDLPEPRGTLHVAFVMGPHAHAEIIAVEAQKARSAEGVVAVLTGADLMGAVNPIIADADQPGYQVVKRPVMAIDRVRFVGEFVAVVLAKNRYLAEDAAALIEVSYKPLPAICDIDSACASDAIKIHETTTDNVLFRARFESPGFDAAFAEAELVVQDTFECGRLAAISIEPRGCLADYDAGRDTLTFWSSTQIPHMVRTELSSVLGWAETKLRVIAPDVGGGFGVKASLYPEEIIVAALSRRLRCPIKWVGDRREDLITSTQARDVRYDISIGFRRNGTLVGVCSKICVNIGAYPTYPFGCSLEAGGAATFLPGPYRLNHYSYETCSVVTNLCPSGPYRGVAAPIAFLAAESLMDQAARELGMDPAELRLKNILTVSEFPYVNVLGSRQDTGSYELSLRRALEAICYAEYRGSQTPDRLVDGKFRGIGIACVTEHTGQGSSRYRKRGIHAIPGYDSALVRVEPNGQALAWISQATQGQGHLTAFAQVVAQNLGLAIDQVTVIEGDTAQGPYGTGTFASRGVVTGGGAVLRASNTVGDKMRRIAAHVLEASAEDVELGGGYAAIKGVSDLRVSVRDIATVAYSLDARELPAGESFGLEATDYYDPPTASINNATHICTVAIDSETGCIEIERYIVVHDCGRIINPLLVDGQIHGAVAQGIGNVLWEAARYDAKGQPVTTSLMEYLIPVAPHLPNIEAFAEETWSLDTAGGFKGVGEGGVIASVPALVNAIQDALIGCGKLAVRLPLTPDRIINLIDSGKKSERNRSADSNVSRFQSGSSTGKERLFPS